MQEGTWTIAGQSGPSESPDLRSMLPEELRDLMAAWGEPPFRAKQIFSWCAKGASSIDDMTNLSKSLRMALKEHFRLSAPVILQRQQSRKDGTIKYLFGLHDGNAVESVLMHYEHGTSLCISSQVGCRMGCTFCASTIGGLVRSLTAGEILEQVIFAGLDSGERIDSLVLMGIGEPFDNYDNVIKFFRLVNHPDGINLGLRHISVSTCGVVPGIYRLAQEGMPVTLSISLHAPNNSLRTAMMPINRKYPLEELVEAARHYAKSTGRKVYIEYTLISGKNDSEAHARELAARLKGILCHVNLIPLNPVDGKSNVSSDRRVIERFAQVLKSCGVSSTVRRKLGDDIDAACGQLRRSSIKEQDHEI